MSDYPFVFGSQYYRAPTPEPECWEQDFARMQELGFNTVKLFVQWRWSHRASDRFVWDDLDALMDIAHAHDIAVNLNTLTDMSPLWLFDKYPDARQVSNAGETIEPYAVSHRSIGGHPGPCYNHPGALAERQLFMRAAFEHFRPHPALATWDVWNEPEQSFQARVPDIRNMTCYCPHCHRGFIQWLTCKYTDLARVNEVWGRCYESWGQVEMPRAGGTITDFIDWREFHLDTMAEEARWRLEMAREVDPDHPRYLHVVPNTMAVFNSVSGVDDFQMAQHCDVFASSMNNSPATLTQLLSAARGKLCYNVESHINFGSIGMHQRRLGLSDVLSDYIPQLGAGIKGFLFWQYRSEVLGAEAPAWGVVGLDGTDRPVTRAVDTFWFTVRQHEAPLLRAQPAPARVGIWKSRRNELFHFAAHNTLSSLIQSVEAYLNVLYWHNIPTRIVSEAMLESSDLEGIDLLIMPSCYYLTAPEAEALDRWVRAGGVLLCEAHLAGYNGTTGRHARILPGAGLSASWGIREIDSTSSYHLRLKGTEAFSGSVPEDVQKALRDLGTTGAQHFPVQLTDGGFAWGGNRYAVLAGESIHREGTFDGEETCIASVEVGEGWVLYSGTNLGEGAARGSDGLLSLLKKCLDRAGIAPTLAAAPELPGTVRIDVLTNEDAPAFLAVTSRADEDQTLSLSGEGVWRGLFTGAQWPLTADTGLTLPAGFTDLMVREG